MGRLLDAELLDRLQALSEQALVKKVILPLLQAMRFDRVEHRHGPLEKGVDILCTGRDRLGFPELIAIQVKKIKVSGAISSPQHFEALFRQLKQALREPIKLHTGDSRRANSAWLLTPFEVPPSKLETWFAEYCESVNSGLRVVDGSMILELLRSHAPSVLQALGDKTHAYLESLRGRVLVLREASALGIVERPLAEFLVEPRLALKFPLLGNALTHGTGEAKGVQRITVPDVQRRWEQFAEELKTILGNEPGVTLGPPKHTRDVFTDGALFLSRLRQHVEALNSSYLKARKAPASDVGTALHQLCFASDHAEELLSWKEASHLVTVERGRRGPFVVEASARELLSSRVSAQVVGDAGFGKTTLLRYLCSLAIDDRERLPVFVTLGSVGSRKSLVTAVSEALASSGYAHSRASLLDALERGNAVLFLDGLDEALPRAPDLRDRIQSFREDFPATQVFLSSRPWAALRHARGMVPMLMQPFTREQLEAFFRKWFPNDQASALSILRHIDEHKELGAPFSTPLVAALLAVVKSRGGQLPRSLPDVYERRLDLLLSAWDSVKGVRRDRFEPQDKRFFLKKFAFRLHTLQLRLGTRAVALKCLREELPSLSTGNSAEAFLDELIRHNNVLFEEEGGDISFGHLQYQEHLAALEARENPLANIAEHLREGWWWGALKMYAQLTSDVSPLIEYAAKHRILETSLPQLGDLITHAPNTNRRSRVLVTRFLEQDEAAASVLAE